MEFHRNQASSFTTQAGLGSWDMPSDYQITNLTGSNVSKVPKPHPEWDEYYKKLRWNGYLIQKEKNRKIVEECKEVLRELE